MSGTLGVVEVGIEAPWTAAKDALPMADRRLGASCLLEWVARRATEAQRLDRVVVLAPDTPRAARWLPPDIEVLVSTAPDPLARLAEVAREQQADAIVRVSLCSPFIDPALIDRLVSDAASHPGCDYISYGLQDGRPAFASQIGLFAEWYRAAALLRADREACRAQDRSSVNSFFCSHPELFQLRLLAVPARLDRPDLRLSIGSEEDWEHAQVIYEALGPEGLDWQRIAQLLDYQPAIRERMARLNLAEHL